MESIDQLGNQITLSKLPSRIVSLVPSQTELLFDLGLDEEVVGITKFCIHPEEQWRKKSRVGGTKQINLDKIRALKPDLIIANKEENTQEDITRLQSEYPVWVSDIYNLSDATDMITSVGSLVGRKEQALSLIGDIERGWNEVRSIANGQRVVYLIWNDPIMVAGSHTFIDAVLQWVGWDNQVREDRYPSLTEDDLVDLAPEVLMLSSEPFPFKEKHFQQFQQLLPNTRIALVDGELFSWYGSRLLKSPDYFKSLLG